MMSENPSVVVKYKIPDSGHEYEKVYPTETKRIAELKRNHRLNDAQFAMIEKLENSGQAFLFEDFTAERE